MEPRLMIPEFGTVFKKITRAMFPRAKMSAFSFSRAKTDDVLYYRDLVAQSSPSYLAKTQFTIAYNLAVQHLSLHESLQLAR